MARRSYEQLCTLARTLDVIGERWTLLLLRELMLGPKRFTDLLDGLPGIGRHLLTARLRHLEEAGLIRRRELPAPGSARVYELTDDGRALGPAMAELGRWGAERLPKPPPGLVFRPGWAVFPISYMADRDAAREVHATYQLHVDEETFHLRVSDGRVEPRAGPAERADVTLTVDGETLSAIFARDLSPIEAVAQGRVAFQGEAEAVERCIAILAGGVA